MSSVFVFFQTYLKQFLALIIYGFVKNFKRYLLIIKKHFNYRDNEEEILKILRGSFFLGHLLVLRQHFFECAKKLISIQRSVSPFLLLTYIDVARGT